MAREFKKKRVYESQSEFFADLWFILRNTKLLMKIHLRGLLPAIFRERLMVAAAAVYGCRFCSWIHAREALRSGLDQEEIAALLSSTMESCPEEYAIAVLYAQHWAESNANPDPEAVKRLEEAYGSEKAELVNVVLRPIRLIHSVENSWAYFLYRISFGRWRG